MERQAKSSTNVATAAILLTAAANGHAGTAAAVAEPKMAAATLPECPGLCIFLFFSNILSSPPHRSFLLQDYAEDSMEGVYYCAVCNEGEAAAYGKKHGYGEDLKEVALREEGPVEAEDGGMHAGIVVDHRGARWRGDGVRGDAPVKRGAGGHQRGGGRVRRRILGGAPGREGRRGLRRGWAKHWQQGLKTR